MGYDEFKSIQSAKKAYKHKRKVQHFILKDSTKNLMLKCCVCKKTLKDDPAELPGYKGNRCEYHPKVKKIIVKHYVCAWKSLIEYIYNDFYDKIMY